MKSFFKVLAGISIIALAVYCVKMFWEKRQAAV